jgi:outer membrane protein OmpA-like peptidoglycan-associated protein
MTSDCGSGTGARISCYERPGAVEANGKTPNPERQVCMRPLKSMLTWLHCLALAGAASAQTRTSLNIERFSPAVDGKGLFATEAGDTLEQFQIHIGQMLHYSRDPLHGYFLGAPTRAVVSDRFMADLYLSAGLTRWLQVGVTLPIAIANVHAALGDASGGGPGVASMVGHVKIRLANGLAVLGRIAGAVHGGGFRADREVSFSPVLALDHAVSKKLRFLANLGYIARQEVQLGQTIAGDELFWRAGLGYHLTDRVELAGEILGSTGAARPFDRDAQMNPLELLLGARYRLGDHAMWQIGLGKGLNSGNGAPAFRVFTGIAATVGERDTDGDGIPDSRDKCPKEPGPAVTGGCPRVDTDQDGVMDDEDRCPAQPGPRENQGCPWPDADRDGVPDKDDKCPSQPGPRENRGCPWPDRDKDGVLDKDDKCPDAPGPAENQGCPWPDRDKDGVPDKDDKCPDEPGPVERQGCPIPKDTDGDGVPDAKDKCPKVPGPAENDGCPWPDRDKDGVPDKDDKCPDQPGPADNQGCPWPDADKDGVPDKDDDCPNQPGPVDNRGCPKTGIVVTRAEVKIDERVRFATGSATIRRQSYKLLDRVAQTLQQVPSIKKLEVQGHTDDVGRAKANERLSQRRAESVRKYLVRKKVAAARLVAKGYGPSKPLVPVDRKKMSKKELRQARETNRRVQFVILEKE